MIFAYRTAAVLAAPAVAAHGAWAAMRPADAGFAPDSFWDAPLPRAVPRYPDSSAFVQAFRRQETAYYDNVDLNTSDFPSSVDVIGPEMVADTDVAQSNRQNEDCKKKNLAQQWKAVPIPGFANAAGGSLTEIMIYQPSRDTL